MTTEQLYHLYLKHPKVATDTRADIEGSLFFALKGDSFDGNDFVGQALEKGAAYCIIDDPKAYRNEQTIVVFDVLETLQQLACHHRQHLSIPVLAITGTNGKTTTKELINAVLSKMYRVSCTAGNLNNHIGVPLTLLSIPQNAEIALIEMGANHIGEIDFLCRIAKPNLGLITNIGKAHLEGFGGFEGVIRTKTELYRYLEAVSGTAFINGDDDMLFLRSGNIKRVFYGKRPNMSVSGNIEKNGLLLSIQMSINDTKYSINTRLAGSYNLYNVLAAACVGHYFKVSESNIVQAIEAYQPDNMRSQAKKIKSNYVILDSYNANPSSMSSALSNFFEMPISNKIVILGDMLELGNWSDTEHKKIVESLVQNKIKRAYLVGKQFGKVSKPDYYMSFPDVEVLRNYLEENPLRNAFILIKGSRGMQLEKILEVL